LALVERLLRFDPANSSYLSLKAQVLRLEGHGAEAIALLEQVIAADPDNARLRLLFGHLLREVGEQAQAVKAYRAALAAQPGMGEAYWSLGNLKTVRFEQADLDAMEQHLARMAPRDPKRIHLEFALGKAYEDAGRYEDSFQHYARGNALQRSRLYYQADEVSAAMQRHRPVYTARFFAERPNWGSERSDPIFVVGLPRAGSTLLEQILASHSQIEGTRELLNLPAIVLDLTERDSPGGEGRYPEPVARLERAQVEDYAAQYLRQTAAFRKSARPRFIDKLPGNFANIGLMHLMFPRATIIDARRHPIGCSFSCFKQYFSRGQSYAYDLEEMGQYYRDYFGLMEHFDTVLPGRVHRVYYEQLVSDPEGEVERLLKHCGLPFEAGCLRFYENRRAVTTISSEQVRRPISAEAIDQWRHYEPWLGPLKHALGDLVERYPIGPQGVP
jgi:tetratricopeptide (TPR) repeat protein